MNQTKDWIYVDNSPDIFRKTEFYSLDWNIDATRLIVCPFGGPIAVTRDIGKPDTKPLISVYSQLGDVIKSFTLEEKSVIIGIGWTCTEDLIIVKETGEIQIRTFFGVLKTLFTMGKDSRAIDFRIFNTINTYTGTYSTGVVIQTAKNKFIIVKDVYDVKIQQFPELPSSVDVESWTIISTDKKCFILASKGADIYQLFIGSAPQILKPTFGVTFSMITRIVPSFNYELVALATDNGYLVMCNNDFSRIIHRYNSEKNEPVHELAWVSPTAVVGFWDSLYLIPLNGGNMRDHLDIFYIGPIHFVQELDGLRIITSDKNEFLQVVPKPLRDVFEIAALDSSSTLYESSIAFYDSRNQKAEEYIRSIKEKGTLEDAIQNCINAAPHEFDPKYQMELLRAALFGRYFDDYANAGPYVRMCQTLRVLNDIRRKEIGLPLTYVQYEALSPPVIINRLVARRHFALAIEICKYLNMSEEDGIIKVLSNWALFKVSQNDIEDQNIAKVIRSKLGETPGISYSEIARCAIKAGRVGLAIRLLEYENKASEQVPLYMDIDNPELAITKALESGDSDLMYMALFWYQSKFNNVSDFMKDISKKYPTGFNLMLQYYRQKDMNEQNTTSTELSSILNQENLLTEQVCLILRVAQKQERIDQKLQMLDEAKRLFGNDEKFNTTLITDEIKLIKIHAQVEKNYRVALYNKSVYETIGELIRKGLLDEAEKTRKEFKISDTSESWWHIKAKHLAVNGNMWDELERFSKSRKSPIGYEPFVTYCMEANNVQEAKKYFPKVAPENRVKCLIKMKCMNDALDVAFTQKDQPSLSLIISKCDPSTQKSIIERGKNLLAELRQKQN